MRRIAFTKMHGAGNDFVLIDDRTETFPVHDHILLAMLAAPRTGIACEGVILVQPSKTVDFRMVFFNPDGTEHINPFTNHADSFWYDLDLAVAVIDDHTIAYCPEALDEASNKQLEALTDIDKIRVDFNECTDGFACNMVSTGKCAIMSNKAPKLQAELEARGITCFTPDVTELKKGGGYIRCVSLWLS